MSITSQEILKAMQIPADLSKLTGVQIANAMHAARKVQLAHEDTSAEWKAAAALIDALTAENHRRLFPNDPAPKSGSHVWRNPMHEIRDLVIKAQVGGKNPNLGTEVKDGKYRAVDVVTYTSPNGRRRATRVEPRTEWMPLDDLKNYLRGLT